MDDIANFNKARWEALARAGVLFSRPWLELDETSARARVDPQRILGEVRGKDVLCLAAGGGQQSAAFALLGADVTVFDLSLAQLERDREAARHYGLEVRTRQGDMRDLRVFADGSFDLVWQAYAVNFVPHVPPVFREVRRVLSAGGLYRLECANPFVAGLCESDWNGEGYLLKRSYADGAEFDFDDPDWEFEGEDGRPVRVAGPREFHHALSTLIGGLVKEGFTILGVWEGPPGDPEAAPGTWEHFVTVAPPWLTFLARKEGA